MSNPAENERTPKFVHGDMAYDRKTGFSYRVEGYTPEGKVAAVRERTEGEGVSVIADRTYTAEGMRAGAESDRTTDKPVRDDDLRLFDENELEKTGSVNFNLEAEMIPENRRDEEARRSEGDAA